jgi:hypothetical protein
MAGRHAQPRGRQKTLLAAAGVTLVGALATLAGGVTYGIYSSTPSGENNGFTSGTVTLTNNVTGACSDTNLAPGDAPAACTLGLTYSGSLSAYLAVDVLIETQAGSGGSTLYNPSGSNGLTVSITDNQSTPVTYTVPTTPTTCPTGAPSGSTCYELDDELIGTSSYASGATDTISTAVTLPSAAGNGYQGGAAQVILTVHAVQAKNNTLNCTTTPAAGQSCSPGTGFAWS